MITIDAGAGQDSITHDVSYGQDTALIDGGADADTLPINQGGQNFSLLDEEGKLIYQCGQGGSLITVKSIEHILVLDSEGQTVFEWHQ